MSRASAERFDTGVAIPDPFLAKLYRPHLRDAAAAIERALEPLAAGAAIRLISDRLLSRLAALLDEPARDAVLRHFERHDAIVDGALSGSYAEHMRGLFAAEGMRALAAESPGLEETLQLLGASFTACVVEALAHGGRDRELLSAEFFGGAPGLSLVDVVVSESDPHQGGRRVTVLGFGDGAGGLRRVVHKPRDVRIDCRLLEVAAKASVATYKVLPREDSGRRYGWVEYLAHGRPEDVLIDAVAARAYYTAIGRFAALAVVFAVEDLHQGNLMVSGGVPYLSDLEIAASSKSFKPGLDTAELVERLLGHTLLDRAVAHGREQMPAPAYAVAEDRLLVVSAAAPVWRVTDNLVALVNANGTAFNHTQGLAAGYRREILAGFEETLAGFAALSKAEADALVASFAGLHVRYLVLPTAVQLNLRRAEERAGLVATAAAREAALSACIEAEMRIRLARNPRLSALIAPTARDIARGDVAYFTQELGTRRLFHNGTDLLRCEAGEEDLLQHDGLDVLRHNLALVGDATGRATMRQAAEKAISRWGALRNEPEAAARTSELLRRLR